MPEVVTSGALGRIAPGSRRTSRADLWRPLHTPGAAGDLQAPGLHQPGPTGRRWSPWPARRGRKDGAGRQSPRGRRQGISFFVQTVPTPRGPGGPIWEGDPKIKPPSYVILVFGSYRMALPTRSKHCSNPGFLVRASKASSIFATSRRSFAVQQPQLCVVCVGGRLGVHRWRRWRRKIRTLAQLNRRFFGLEVFSD
jgi:hypothetical protein